MTQCRTCGHDLSLILPRCPGCNARPGRLLTMERKRNVLAGAFVALMVGALVYGGLSGDHNPIDQPTSSTEAPYGSVQYCLKAAPGMVRQHPELTPTNQSAYDGCRAAAQFLDQQNGKVNP